MLTLKKKKKKPHTAVGFQTVEMQFYLSCFIVSLTSNKRQIEASRLRFMRSSI